MTTTRCCKDYERDVTTDGSGAEVSPFMSLKCLQISLFAKPAAMPERL